MKEGDRIKLVNPEALREMSVPIEYLGRTGRLARLTREGNYMVVLDSPAAESWYVKPISVELLPQVTETTNQTNTETTNKKEQHNMYVYKVRMNQVPNALAQQAGEKESIVVPSTEVVATNEFAAVALVAIDNVEIIKAVQASKGSLSVTCKNVS